MAVKAFPALVLLALVCGQLAIAGHAQTLLGGPRAPTPAATPSRDYAGARPPAGMQPPVYTRPTPGYDGPGRVNVPGVGEEKAFMFNSVPAHDRARPVPVPPTSN